MEKHADDLWRRLIDQGQARQSTRCVQADAAFSKAKAEFSKPPPQPQPPQWPFVGRKFQG